MNKNFTPSRSHVMTQVQTTGFQGHLSSRVGNMRAVIFKSKTVNVGEVFDVASWSVYEHSKNRFSKNIKNGQVQIDKKPYEIRKYVLSAVGVTKASSK
jgi:hypothetical protein